jgi:methanogenic corrinoid protein MtbC1
MKEEILKDLERAIIRYDKTLAAGAAKRAIEGKLDLMEVLDVMTAAVRQVGDGFAKGELWLPDLVGAGEAMASALPIIEEELRKTGQRRASLGTVVIGTVYGDFHTIGKTLVAALLRAEGFTVYDAGVNVIPEEFVEAVRTHSPDILAMSALMTMTAPEQKKTIEILKKEGLRVKVKIMVGGGAITQGFADSIGADGYDPTAPGAAKLARRLLGK